MLLMGDVCLCKQVVLIALQSSAPLFILPSTLFVVFDNTVCALGESFTPKNGPRSRQKTLKARKGRNGDKTGSGRPAPAVERSRHTESNCTAAIRHSHASVRTRPHPACHEAVRVCSEKRAASRLWQQRVEDVMAMAGGSGGHTGRSNHA